MKNFKPTIAKKNNNVNLILFLQYQNHNVQNWLSQLVYLRLIWCRAHKTMATISMGGRRKSLLALCKISQEKMSSSCQNIRTVNMSDDCEGQQNLPFLLWCVQISQWSTQRYSELITKFLTLDTLKWTVILFIPKLNKNLNTLQYIRLVWCSYTTF